MNKKPPARRCGPDSAQHAKLWHRSCNGTALLKVTFPKSLEGLWQLWPQISAFAKTQSINMHWRGPRAKYCSGLLSLQPWGGCPMFYPSSPGQEMDKLHLERCGLGRLWPSPLRLPRCGSSDRALSDPTAPIQILPSFLRVPLVPSFPIHFLCVSLAPGYPGYPSFPIHFLRVPLAPGSPGYPGFLIHLLPAPSAPSYPVFPSSSSVFLWLPGLLASSSTSSLLLWLPVIPASHPLPPCSFGSLLSHPPPPRSYAPGYPGYPGFPIHLLPAPFAPGFPYTPARRWARLYRSASRPGDTGWGQGTPGTAGGHEESRLSLFTPPAPPTPRDGASQTPPRSLLIPPTRAQRSFLAKNQTQHGAARSGRDGDSLPGGSRGGESGAYLGEAAGAAGLGRGWEAAEGAGSGRCCPGRSHGAGQGQVPAGGCAARPAPSSRGGRDPALPGPAWGHLNPAGPQGHGLPCSSLPIPPALLLFLPSRTEGKGEAVSEPPPRVRPPGLAFAAPAQRAGAVPCFLNSSLLASVSGCCRKIRNHSHFPEQGRSVPDKDCW